MAKQSDTKKVRNKALIFFGAGVVAFLLDVFVSSFAIKILAEFSYFVLFILAIIYSVKLIRRKDYPVGITLLVLSSLALLLFLIGFLIGFVIGIVSGLQ